MSQSSDSILDNETMKAAVHATVAKTIIENMDPAVQQAILTEAVKRHLDSFDLRSAIGETMKAAAVSLAEKFCSQPDVQDRIQASIAAGFNQYLKHLEVSMAATFKAMFHGTTDRGIFSNAYGRVLDYWPKEDKENAK